jgi:D-alanyl-D-alanine carboxypeptidase
VKNKSTFWRGFFAAVLASLIPLVNQANASGEVAFNVSTGQIIAGKNQKVQYTPASIAKVMTAAVVFDLIHQGKASLDDIITVKRKIDIRGVKAFKDKTIPIGTQFTVRDAIIIMHLNSANDMAQAIADHFDGDEIFVKAMNDTAKKMGMNDSIFSNSYGLQRPHKTLTTPEDAAKLVAYVVKSYPDFLPLLQHNTAEIHLQGGRVNRHGSINPLKLSTVITKTGTGGDEDNRTAANSGYFPASIKMPDGSKADCVGVVLGANSHSFAASRAASLCGVKLGKASQTLAPTHAVVKPIFPTPSAVIKSVVRVLTDPKTKPNLKPLREALSEQSR